MKQIAKEVRDYWSRRGGFEFDAPTLDKVVGTLDPSEQKILEKGETECRDSESLYESYSFTQRRALARYNDIIAGFTEIVDENTVEITDKSSITELDISLKTLENCNLNQFFRIEDINKDVLPTLSLEAIADVTAAILIFQTKTQE